MTYLWKLGHNTAWLFNHYLATGDSLLFRMPILAYTGSKGNYYAFWQNLYQYNQSLPTGQRIKIHGVDFERTEVFKILLLLKPQGKATPENLQPEFKQINSYAVDTTLTCFSKDFIQKFKNVQQELVTHKGDVASLHGDNFAIVRYMVDNEGPHTTATPKRNRCMAHNMQQILAEEKIDRFVGFFGAAHTSYRTIGTMPNRVKSGKDTVKRPLSSILSILMRIATKRRVLFVWLVV